MFTTSNNIPVSLRPIKSEEGYNEALRTLENIMEEENKDDDGIITALAILIEEYEEEHYAIKSPDPIEAIKYMMTEMDLSQKDLTQYIGTKSLVSQILNKKRKLSIANIRILSKELNLPIEILVQDYSLADEEMVY